MDFNVYNIEEFENFIKKKDHPCIMAQAIFSLENYIIKSYTEFGSKNTASSILKDIKQFLNNYDFKTNDFSSFIAVFESEINYTELEFEKLLWQQLQFIHDADTVNWDNTVSNNPENESFSFSICGKAFFIIGMHPNSSRSARKSHKTSIVFNLHWQFEKLRKQGVYKRIRDTIRQRDLQKNGSINPMVIDFGKHSEVMQYSGRYVDDNWKCPFNPNTN